MFKINHQINRSFNSHSKSLSDRRALTTNTRQHLANVLTDFAKYRSSLIARTNGISQLSKIRDQRYLADKNKQIGNLNNLRDRHYAEKAEHKVTELNTGGMPKPRSYEKLKADMNNETLTVSDEAGIANILNTINQNEIDEFQKNDPLAQKETKVVDSPAELAKLLNSVSNNVNTELNTNNIQNISEKKSINIPQQQIQAEQKEEIKPIELLHVISHEELIGKAQMIADNIQINIYHNPQYNFFKFIQFVYNMYEQYADNHNVYMIIIKGFMQFNKKQMIKLPEDKIPDIITYIIEQIKK